MKKYRLGNSNSVVLLDDDSTQDEFNWSLSLTGYAVRKVGGRKGKIVYLHSEIMGRKEGYVIDHINLDKLDCRRSNMRFVKRSFNNLNRGLNKNNTSGTKGVYFSRYYGRWAVRIKNQFGNLSRTFDTKENAENFAKDFYKKIGIAYE